jgi:RNA polymerase sigma-70 factor (ECF subfamily)
MPDPNPDTPETLDLLVRARAGDGIAFNRLFEHYRPYLARMVRFRMDERLRHRVDPSDVVQETHLEALRRFRAYIEHPDVPFRLWLRQLAAERISKLRRYHLHTAQHLPGTGNTPSQVVSKEELAGRVRGAVERLEPADREVIVLRVFEGLSHDEVAYLLGIDVPAARKRHSRALVKLHRMLFVDGEAAAESLN